LMAVTRRSMAAAIVAMTRRNLSNALGHLAA
jgi:hypothetical protein